MKHSRIRWFSKITKFSGAFAKWQKATMRFVMSACLSVHPHETIRLPFDGFSWNMTFQPFSKIYRENSDFIKIWQEYLRLYMKTNTHFWLHLTCFLFERVMFQKKVVEKIKTHILCSITFLRESCPLYDVQTYFWSGQTTKDNMDHVHCILDT